MLLAYLLISTFGSTTTEFKAAVWDEAHDLCMGSTDSKLPAVQTTSDVKMFVTFMTKHNISSAWTAWRLKSLIQWTWTNSKPSHLPVKEHSTNDTCGCLDVLDRALSSSPCHTPRRSICQLNDGHDCDALNKTQDICIRFGGVTYLAMLLKINWFTASTSCNNLGGSLAILDTKKKISNLIDYMISRSPTLRYETKLYLGVRHQSWIKSVGYNGLFQMNHAIWAHGNPVAGHYCSFVRASNHSSQVFSEDCNSSHSVVCYNTALHQYNFLEDVYITRPAATTHSVTGENQNENSQSVALYVGLGLPVGIMLIIGIALTIFYFRKKWLATSTQNKNNDQELEPLNTTSNQPFFSSTRSQKSESLHQSGTYLHSTASISSERALNKMLSSDHKQALHQNQQHIIENVCYHNSFTKLRGYDPKGENKIITILNNIKTIQDYQSFCEALLESGQKGIIEEYLITPYDATCAIEKLRDYYIGEFSNISLYSKNPEFKCVANDYLFVPMTWGQYKDRYFKELEQMKTANDMFSKIRTLDGLSRNNRVLVEGDPGTGKTTFVKRMCYLWAKGTKDPKGLGIGSDLDTEEIMNYSTVIPVVLRMVDLKSNLLQILQNQLSFLSIIEIMALLKEAENYPEKFLFLLDGFDEMREGNLEMKQILSAEKYKRNLFITTTRTYAVSSVFNLMKNSVDLHFKLKGFSDDQILLYFQKFCVLCGKDTQLAKELYNILVHQRKDLFEIAHIPIRCEIISIVWNAYGRLGETVADLYIMFIVHLLHHWEAKQSKSIENGPETSDGFDERPLEQVVLEKNQDILMKIGKLATTWTKSYKMCIIFSTQQVQHILGGGGRTKAAEIGLLTKSHPSSELGKASWNFPHLTIQEFLASYYLAHCADTERDSFLDKFKSMKLLLRSEVIFQFLVSKYPKTANHLLGQLIKMGWKINEDKQMVEFLMKLYPYFAENVHLPLPNYVDTKTCQDKGILLKLLEMDKSSDLQNLKTLYVREQGHYCKFLGQEYLKELHIILNKTGMKNCCKSMLQKMVSLEKFVIEIKKDKSTNSKNEAINSDENGFLERTDDNMVANMYHTPELQEHLVTNRKSQREKSNPITPILDSVLAVVPMENMECLKITSEKLPSNLDGVLSCAPKLKELCVSGDSRLEGLSQENVKKLDSLGILTNEPAGLFTANAKNIELWLNETTHTKLQGIVCDLNKSASPSHLKMLCFVDSYLTSCGELLGEVLTSLVFLEMLVFCECRIKKSTLTAMTRKIIGKKCSIIDLFLQKDDLSGCGRELGILVSLLPDLCSLHFYRNSIVSNDLSEMAVSIPQNNSIETFIVKENGPSSVECYDSDAMTKLLSKMPNMQYLVLLKQQFFDPLHSITEAVFNQALVLLRFLLICGNNEDLELCCRTTSDSFTSLGVALANMKQLEHLEMSYISGVDAEEYQSIYQNLPLSLRHITLLNEKIDPQILLQNKKHFRYIQRLNVLLEDTELEMLQEQIEDVNPEILVYCDKDEYVLHEKGLCSCHKVAFENSALNK